MRPKKRDEGNPEGDFPPGEWFWEQDTFFYPSSVRHFFTMLFGPNGRLIKLLKAKQTLNVKHPVVYACYLCKKWLQPDQVNHHLLGKTHLSCMRQIHHTFDVISIDHPWFPVKHFEMSGRPPPQEIMAMRRFNPHGDTCGIVRPNLPVPHASSWINNQTPPITVPSGPIPHMVPPPNILINDSSVSHTMMVPPPGSSSSAFPPQQNMPFPNSSRNNSGPHPMWVPPPSGVPPPMMPNHPTTSNISIPPPMMVPPPNIRFANVSSVPPPMLVPPAHLRRPPFNSGMSSFKSEYKPEGNGKQEAIVESPSTELKDNLEDKKTQDGKMEDKITSVGDSGTINKPPTSLKAASSPVKSETGPINLPKPVPANSSSSEKAVANIFIFNQRASAQGFFDRYRDQCFVGLEYLVEIQNENILQPPAFSCRLCDSTFKPKGEGSCVDQIRQHVLMNSHKIKYLNKHFPTVCEYKLKSPNTMLMNDIVRKVEKKFGRMKLKLVKGFTQFKENIQFITNEIEKGEHYSEDQEIVDIVLGKKPEPTEHALDRAEKEHLRSMSPLSDIDSPDEADKEEEKGTKKGSVVNNAEKFPHKDVLSMPDFSSVSDISDDEVQSIDSSEKRQNFRKEREDRVLAFKAELESMTLAIEKKRALCLEDPTQHPAYEVEWRRFWERKTAELRAKGLTGSDYDMEPEWIIKWKLFSEEDHAQTVKRMRGDLMRKYKLLDRDLKEFHVETLESPTDVERGDISGGKVKEPQRPSSPWEDSVNHGKERELPKSKPNFIPDEKQFVKERRSPCHDSKLSKDKVYSSHSSPRHGRRSYSPEVYREGYSPPDGVKRDHSSSHRYRSDRSKSPGRSQLDPRYREDCYYDSYPPKRPRQSDGPYRSDYRERNMSPGRELSPRSSHSGQRRRSPPSSQPKTEVSVLSTLRLMSALEPTGLIKDLGPTIDLLLCKSLGMENREYSSSSQLINAKDCYILFSDVRSRLQEKISLDSVTASQSQVCRVIIDNVTILLQKSTFKPQDLVHSNSTKQETVPGNDDREIKMAIAQSIDQHLKTLRHKVSHEEFSALVEAEYMRIKPQLSSVAPASEVKSSRTSNNSWEDNDDELPSGSTFASGSLFNQQPQATNRGWLFPCVKSSLNDTSATTLNGSSINTEKTWDGSRHTLTENMDMGSGISNTSSNWRESIVDAPGVDISHRNIPSSNNSLVGEMKLSPSSLAASDPPSRSCFPLGGTEHVPENVSPTPSSNSIVNNIDWTSLSNILKKVNQPSEASGTVVVKQEKLDPEPDPFDDFTDEELVSLLTNFKTLQTKEQKDLIVHMKRMEKNNPERVKSLKKMVLARQSN